MDSQSVLKTLESKHSVSDRTTVKIQSLLTDAKGEIILQWIPAHHDIAGNKLADSAAITASQMDQSGVPISFKSIKAAIKENIIDPNITHSELNKVDSYKIQYKSESTYKQREQRLLRQLRTSHCTHLNSHKYKIESSSNPLCKSCKEYPDGEDHHWAYCPEVIHHWGQAKPSSEHIWQDTQMVMSFLQRTYP